VLSRFYESIEKLGFTVGGEFSAAVQEARSLNVPVLLGDRDVDVTLQRLAEALSRTDSKRFDEAVLQLSVLQRDMGLSDAVPGRGISKEELSGLVENLKKGASQLDEVMRTQLPEIFTALIDERDRFMASSLAQAEGDVIVAVVGKSHMRGIAQYLTDTEGFEVIPCAVKN